MFISLQVEIADGKSVYYPCTDPNALLDDDSGLNFMEFSCNNTVLGYVDVNGTFNAGLPTTWPICRSICPELDIGNKQFVPLNTTVELRAGDTHEFVCPDGFFVEGQSHYVTSLVSQCLPTGIFEQTTLKCFLIPCTQIDIDSLTFNTTYDGIFATSSSGDIVPADSIGFDCVDSTKVHNFANSNLLQGAI